MPRIEIGGNREGQEVKTYDEGSVSIEKLAQGYLKLFQGTANGRVW